MKITKLNPVKPKVGMIMTVRGVKCRIIKVHKRERAVDCVSLDGKHAYRVSGLYF